MRLRSIAVLAIGAVALAAMPAHAQLFGDRPAPVPPANVPITDAPPGSAISLAPPSGPGAVPLSAPLPPPISGGSSLTPNSTAATPSTPTTGQVTLILSARYGKDASNIGSGLIWRVYGDKPDATGVFKQLKEERSVATPNFVLPAGNYVVHVSLGLASAVRAVTLKQETVREVFDLPAGGLRIEGRVGTSKIPPGQVTFNIYKGSQFDPIERAPIAQNVAAGDVAVIPEGLYYIVSNYGDGNSVVRSDIRVQAGKLTDVIVTHRAALIMLKLVSDNGGEALANTQWSVLTPGGDVIKESIGAFPRVVLAEGEYRAVAKNEGKVYQRDFNVVSGADGEVEVVAK
jgi:hypothetical protein